MGDRDSPLENKQRRRNRDSGNRDRLTVYSIVGCRKIKEEQIWEIKGRKDKDKREQQKKDKHSSKEKRHLKREKKT